MTSIPLLTACIMVYFLDYWCLICLDLFFLLVYMFYSCIKFLVSLHLRHMKVCSKYCVRRMLSTCVLIIILSCPEFLCKENEHGQKFPLVPYCFALSTRNVHTTLRQKALFELNGKEVSHKNVECLVGEDPDRFSGKSVLERVPRYLNLGLSQPGLGYLVGLKPTCRICVQHKWMNKLVCVRGRVSSLWENVELLVSNIETVAICEFLIELMFCIIFFQILLK